MTRAGEGGGEATEPMRFAIADPPYLGCGKLYAQHHADALDCNNPAWHQALIDRLAAEYPDGWVLCLNSPTLRTILNMCPADVRVGSWVKPFCSFKPGVGVAYAWEPVIFRGGRKRTREQPTVRDWVSENITLRKGMTGAKPEGWTRWALDLLNARRSDVIDDLFPGSGAVQDAITAWRDQPSLYGEAS